MKHLFDVDVAAEHGVNAAILLESIAYWVTQNEANQTNYFDGRYWTYNSRRAYAEMFPYMSKRQVDTAFEKLINAGLIVTGNYNKLAYDRTLWYALTQKGKSILHFGVMDNSETENGKPENGQPIPIIKPSNKPVTKPVNRGQKKKKEFIPPTLEEIQAYCKERKNNVNAEKFFDFYSPDWIDSNGKPVLNWKQKVITWEGSKQNAKPVRTEIKPEWLETPDGEVERLKRMAASMGKGADP